ncbi:flavodoxin [Sporomusa acidovorans]|uniref:Flavodoxin n=1 Tax=Sporomusa acidovorans (strain ATCC 49682 / DSM 3132 / Mol) TaxID=1123286 RepID=A0ABZ3IXR7_SPOA4|nr:flavodoxin [Sporomusa acidovorans]OZC23292.1 flavodoxin [Sporomusa acidovorans DSM 3132]SDE40823.1 flavodoxin, short chain [Sporomusa acidovorans]
MKKVRVIYWSGTGNTEKMAQAVASGAKTADTEVTLLSVAEATAKHVEEADYLALGCPSMGNEELEESEMEPFVNSIASLVKNKPLVLFGSYGWGDGQWMNDWTQRMKDQGATLVDDSLIINETPDDEGLKKCRTLGMQLVK